MPLTITIIGPVPENDLSLLKTTITDSFEKDSVSFSLVQSPDDLNPKETAGLCAYFVFLPFNTQALVELFSRLPVGASIYYPVFQFTGCDAPLDPKVLDEYPLSGIYRYPVSPVDIHNILKTMVLYQNTTQLQGAMLAEAFKYRKEKYQLLKVGTALSEHYSLDTLLKTILIECCEILNADAGSVYIRERDATDNTFTDSLRFKVSINHSITFNPPEEFTIKIDQNRIAGYAAATKEIVNIADVYHMDSLVPYHWIDDFDRAFNYRTKSILTLPLENTDGMVIGVLQVMNKKGDAQIKMLSPADIERYVIPFSYMDEALLRSLGSLASASIERTQLHENIERIFEGFISASIAAIEERDKATFGHSRRVMEYILAFAQTVNTTDTGFFSTVTFTEQKKKLLKYAALLHDIGKIGVPEDILTKNYRLKPEQLAMFQNRCVCISYLLRSGIQNKALPWSNPHEVDQARAFVERINKAGVITGQESALLNQLKEYWFFDLSGQKRHFLSPEEFEELSIPKGNLTVKERSLMESHAMATYHILSQIPWSLDLKELPEIASRHHEMIDGSGYPHHLTQERIPLETKILTVVDIFDALISQDRPYKPALPVDRALAILTSEAAAGHLDKNIVDFFIEKKIYSLYVPA